MTHFDTDCTDGYTSEQLTTANGIMDTWCRSWREDEITQDNEIEGYKRACEQTLFAIEAPDIYVRLDRQPPLRTARRSSRSMDGR